MLILHRRPLMQMSLDFMMEESLARQLLIDSCYSSSEAEQRIRVELLLPEFVETLVRIAVDEDDYEGDAPMQAAYFLSEAPLFLIRPHESELLRLLTTADGYKCWVAIALGRIKSPEAKPVILRMVEEGLSPPHLFEQAVGFYEGA
jgi:hypothetical protein